MLFIPDRSAPGDIDKVRCAGDGVERGEPWFDACSLSEGAFTLAAAAALAPLASASAVARAASSRVPVCRFWWRVKVVRRVNVFWQSA